jgi:flagellar biogenesis protein FliO
MNPGDSGEHAERRRRARRERQISIFDERRLGERRRVALDLLDRVRVFLGLPPLQR